MDTAQESKHKEKKSRNRFVMKTIEEFKEQRIPKIYAYTDTRFEGWLKVGYTNKSVQKRVDEQYPVKVPTQSWEIILEELALRDDGTFFTDYEIHKQLKDRDIACKGEWFQCSLDEVKACIVAEKKRIFNVEKRTANFPMRPEQQEAVEKTMRYFRSVKADNQIPHFLWNAKMRFGKTFAAYQLALKMNWKRVLILTFKPAVQSAWRDDLRSHIDFEGWQFVSNKEEDLSIDQVDRRKPFVFFGSFQDILGTDKSSKLIHKPKGKNKWIHHEPWDCVIFDEYHFGAWRENAQNLFGADLNADEENKKTRETEQHFANGKEDGASDLEAYMPITTQHYLYLSGTPFRAITSAEFIEEAIFSWTYSDEQKAKHEWSAPNNPYASLPQLTMLTYKLPQEIEKIAKGGEYNEFDLNVFFSTVGKENKVVFKYENEVQKWLDFIRLQYKETSVDILKQGQEKPAMPYADVRLLRALQHTFWFLPDVASCYAMANLLKQPQNKFYHDYEIIVCAGTKAGVGEKALELVKNAMREPLKTKTITLSCGKLTTGVSVPQWSGVFMLRNSSSPETYFQTIFRVQTPWTVKNPDKDAPNREEIIKHECYVFDFDPNRALSQIAKYTSQLNPDNGVSPETKVADFIKFLPVLAYDGSTMKCVNATEILDIAISGTTATLLARRWESALLVNVDNFTLQRLMSNEQAMEALKKIEGFRSLNNSDLQTIINKSEAIKKVKKEMIENDEEFTKSKKREISEQEKEVKSLRKQIQEKLIKFATRIPVFMYLTDFREHTLKDIITKLEPQLFKKVTGLTIDDFSLLETIGLFNGSSMNEAVYHFKRYEDASLNYTGIDKSSETIGLYNSVITANELHS